MLTGSPRLEDMLFRSDSVSLARWICDDKVSDWRIDIMVRSQGIIVMCSCGGLACATGLAA